MGVDKSLESKYRQLTKNGLSPSSQFVETAARLFPDESTVLPKHRKVRSGELPMVPDTRVLQAIKKLTQSSED